MEVIIKESPEPPALRLHPNLSQRYHEMVEDLARSLNAPEVRREATASLRPDFAGTDGTGCGCAGRASA